MKAKTETAAKTGKGKTISSKVSIPPDKRGPGEARLLFLANLIDNLPDALISTDMKFTVREWNVAAENMYGWTAAEVKGHPLLEFIQNEYIGASQDAVFKTVLEQGLWKGEATQKRKDGKRIRVMALVSLVKDNAGQPIGLVAIHRHITGRKRAKGALRKAHDRLELEVQLRTAALSQANMLLQTMLNYVPDQIYFKDAESRFIKNSMSQAKALGLNDPSEAEGKTDFDFFPHAQRAFDEEQEIIRSGKPLVDFEEWVVWPDGKETWVSTSKAPLRNQEGKIIGTFGISRDITDRKRAEESLRKAKEELEVRVAERTAELIEANERLQLELSERKQVQEALHTSEKRFRALIENAPDGITVVDAQGTAIYVGPSIKRILDYSPAEALGRAAIEYVHPEDRLRLLRQLAQLSRRPAQALVQYRFRHKDGSWHWLESMISNLSAEPSVEGIVFNYRDITERKRAEDRLIYLQRSYATLSQVNETIVRVKDRQELFEAICKVAIDFGRFRLAWIGLYDKDSGELTPVAEHGIDGNKLPFNRVNAFEMPYQEGLIGLCLCSGQVEFSNDIHLDPRMLHWRETAIKEGYHSAAVIPIRINGQIIGLLNLYAADIGFFAIEEEQHLLAEMGVDISFALETMQVEAERKQAEEMRAQLAAIVESSDDAIIAKTLDGIITSWNKGAEKVYGYVAAEAVGRSISILIPSDLANELSTILNRLKKGESINHYETTRLRKDGQRINVSVTISPIRDMTGNIGGASTIARDITERKRAEAAVLESERQMRALVTSLDDIVFEFDEQGTYLNVWAANEDLLAQPKAQLRGQRIVDVLGEENGRPFADAVKRVVASGEPESIEYPLEVPSGQRWFVARISPILAQDNSYQTASILIRDITERKRAEERLRDNEELFRTSFQYSPIGMCLTSLDGRFLNVNQSLSNMLGFTKEELQEKHFNEITHPEDLEIGRDALLKMLSGEILNAEFEKRYLPKAGEPIWMQVNTTLLNDSSGKPLHFVTHILNITERKHAEEASKRYAFELEQRVAERTAELNHLNAELERASHAKDEFLANMSHELRTPLNGILGFSEILLDQIQGTLNEYQQKAVHAIEASGRLLLELINDILDLSKIDAGKFDLHPEIVRVQDLCETSLDFVTEMANKKSVAVNFQTQLKEAKIHADPRRLKQALVNLLSNAVKFAPANGQVTLEVEADLEQDRMRFSVIDNGIGIAPDELRQLFKPFIQIDSRLNRQYNGTGLGLALVLRLTEMHGGSVQVDSEVGKGSRFTINLPWGQAAIARQATEQPEIEPITNNLMRATAAEEPICPATILLAEDHETNIMVVRDYLAELGYKVEIAHNGLEVLALAEAFNPHIILMDIQMPVMDGLEATRQLRANPRFAATSIIALTALAMPGDRERCLQAGANEYLSKPVSLKKLKQTIEQFLQR